MGMIIANPIQTLKYLRTSGVFPFSTKEGVLYTAESIDVVIETMRKYQQLEDFARWVAVEVTDEELWTYNNHIPILSFTEIACHKLVQLGIMQESDGEYTYEEVEDGNDDNANE